MKESTVKIELPSENPEEMPRECHMSIDLYQNARMTMGELRDMVREGVFSWEFLEYVIGQSRRPLTPIDKALQKLDDYTTGIGKTLHDKPCNVF